MGHSLKQLMLMLDNIKKMILTDILLILIIFLLVLILINLNKTNNYTHRTQIASEDLGSEIREWKQDNTIWNKLDDIEKKIR